MQTGWRNAVSTPQTAQQDYSKFVLGMYFDAIQQWNRSYDNAKQVARQQNTEYQPYSSSSEPRAVRAKTIAAQCYRRAIEHQMARCRFFEHRWSRCLGLPDAISACKSPLDLLTAQASFLKQAFDDYAMESARVMEFYWPWAPKSVFSASR
jgi:hypothetical protein